MTPEQITLVQEAAGRIRGRLTEVTTAFYRRLFAAHPDLRAMFPADLELQKRKFADEFDVIVRTISDFPKFLHEVRALGARHAGYGTRVAHYPLVREALTGALAEALGAGWTPEVELAWTAAFNMVAEVMMLGGGTPVARPTIAGRATDRS